MRRSTRRESNNKAVTSIEKAKHFCVLGQDQDGLEARYINDYIGDGNRTRASTDDEGTSEKGDGNRTRASTDDEGTSEKGALPRADLLPEARVLQGAGDVEHSAASTCSSLCSKKRKLQKHSCEPNMKVRKYVHWKEVETAAVLQHFSAYIKGETIRSLPTRQELETFKRNSGSAIPHDLATIKTKVFNEKNKWVKLAKRQMDEMEMNK